MTAFGGLLSRRADGCWFWSDGTKEERVIVLYKQIRIESVADVAFELVPEQLRILDQHLVIDKARSLGWKG